MAYPSKRKLILDRILSLLSNINTSNGFPISIVSASTEILDIENLHSEQTPHIGISIGSGGANNFITTGSNVDSMVTYVLNSYIYVQPGVKPVEELDKINYSIEFALLNGTPNNPWNDKYLTASLNGLEYVYYVSFDENFNTDEGILSLEKKAYSRWSLTVKYLKSTINP